MKTNPISNVDFNSLKRGIYIAKINEDITTYDIRIKEPNREPVLTNAAIHTTEHILKEYLSKSEFADNIIFFGGMASRTGYYLITKNLSDKYTLELIKSMFSYVEEFWGKIPNSSLNECGNCKELNLPQAKEEAKHFNEVIKDWTKEMLAYPNPEIEE